MFVYSLSGLELDDTAAAPVEIEENETTARSAMYQVLGRLLAPPEEEQAEWARDGRWPKEFAANTALLPFPFDAGEPAGVEALTLDDLQRGYDAIASGDSPAILVGSWTGDVTATREEVARFYEYYGLRAGADRPVDHLGVECDFLQFLAFKEAAASSDRLRASFRRAQRDFLDRQLGKWAGDFEALCRALDAGALLGWAAGTLTAFVTADQEYVRSLTG